jgi:hypothetical protein
MGPKYAAKIWGQNMGPKYGAKIWSQNMEPKYGPQNKSLKPLRGFKGGIAPLWGLRGAMPPYGV